MESRTDPKTSIDTLRELLADSKLLFDDPDRCRRMMGESRFEEVKTDWRKRRDAVLN